MLRASRARMAAVLVLGILGVTTVATATVFPTPAYAAATNFTTYSGQGNLTVLPSTAQPLFAGVADASPQGQVGQYLYAAMKDPKKMAAITALYQRAQAGTATVAERAELTTALRASAPVATRTALLTRGVASAAGPAGLVITSAEMGFAIGAGVSSAMGMDVDGGLCRGGAGGQALAFVSGVSCSKFWETVNKTTINSDASSGAVGTMPCVPGTSTCAQWVGSTTNQSYGWVFHSFKATDVQSPDSSNSIRSKDGKYYLIVFSSATEQMQTYFVGTDGSNPDRANCIKGSTACTYDAKSLKSGSVAGYSWAEVGTQKLVGDRGKVSTSTGDPDRAMRCTQTYKSGGRDTRTGDSRKLSEGMPPAPDLPVPAGEIVTNITCELYAGDGTAPAYETFKQDTTPEYQKSAAVNPECGSTTVCELQLVKPDGKVCNDTDTTCAAWQESPDASQWTCRWGNTQIGFKPADMSECNWYSNRWDPQRQASGDTLTAPATSSPSKTPEAIKNPAPALTPGTDPNLSNEPVKDPEKGDAQCFPNGWGALNPLAWVYQPVKCAIEWAFVPRPSKMRESGDKLTKAWKSTSPFVLADAVGTWDFEPAMTGCNGIPLPADLIYKGMPAQRIASACEGTPLHPAAVAIRVFLNIFFGVGAAFMIASYMGWTIGFKGPTD